MRGAAELLGLGVMACVRIPESRGFRIQQRPKQFRWGDAEGCLLEEWWYFEKELSEEMKNSYVSFEEMVRRERAGERRHLEELRREQCATTQPARH